MIKGKRFYKDGLRFECQGEGNCCVSRGSYGYVYLSFSDRRRLADHFKMSTSQFTATFTNKIDGLYELRYTGKDCPFLQDNRCRVYKARPWQCRTWPFWPENMNSVVWENEVSAWCPGAGRGKLYTATEIEEILSKKKDVS
jgi:Fe-S-cluster containining protein